MIDTYHMTAATIDEAVRKVLAVGGDPDHLGGVDNFCWPTVEYDPISNPDGQYKAAQLVRSNWALRDTCLAYGIPLLSGKDSMYIDGNLKGPFGERRKVSGLPTLLFTVSSVMADITRCVSMEPKFPGDIIYVLGEIRNELGGSEFYQMMGQVGLNVPKVDAETFLPRYRVLHQAIADRLVSSCHAVSRGGLAVHLALAAMAGDLGMEIDLNKVPGADALTPTQVLYSESCGRFIVTVAHEKQAAFEALFSDAGVGCIGTVTPSPRVTIQCGGDVPLISEDLATLKASWQRPFGELI